MLHFEFILKQFGTVLSPILGALKVTLLTGVFLFLFCALLLIQITSHKKACWSKNQICFFIFLPYHQLFLRGTPRSS